MISFVEGPRPKSFKMSDTQSRVSLVLRPHQLPSIILAMVYLALMSMATLCVTSHELQHSPIGHHSNSSLSHSSLCAWACQVGSKANAADTTHAKLLMLPMVVAGLVFLFFLIPTQAILRPALARGPPL